MQGVAAVLVDAEVLWVWAVPEAPVRGALVELGLGDGAEPGALTGDWWLLEPVCSALDRHGYRWAADTAAGPRTWAERLFAETPPQLGELLYNALRGVLAGEGGDHDHLAVLDWAWRCRPPAT